MCVYEAHSGQNHDNKIALQVSFNLALQQILWTCCLFLSSINNTFFSVLVIIFSKMSYFCFNYTNTFFIHTMNYFSVVLRIIFLMCIENYFFIGPRIIFRGIAKSFLSLQCFIGVAVAVDWFEFLDDFHSPQNFGNFGWYIKWNGPFRFGPTGIFETSFEGGPLWPVWSFRSVGPECLFPFVKIVAPSTALLYPAYNNK